MPTAHCRRALALLGLIFSPSLTFASQGWKTVTLPFSKGLTLELPSVAKPELMGQEWFANSFASGVQLPERAGFASAFLHRLEENPLTLERYKAGVSIEERVRDLTVAKCYAENADIYSYCPPELVKVRTQDSRWGKLYVVSGVMRFRRGGVGEVPNEAMMIALPVGENEAVVFRSLGGEIKKRLLGSLGIEVKQEFLAPKKAPLNLAVPLPAKAAPPSMMGAPTDPKMAPQVPPGNRVD